MYEEIEKVFAKITEFAEQGKVIPIQEAYYCYTVSISFIQNIIILGFGLLFDAKRVDFRAILFPKSFLVKAWT